MVSPVVDGVVRYPALHRCGHSAGPHRVHVQLCAVQGLECRGGERSVSFRLQHPLRRRQANLFVHVSSCCVPRLGSYQAALGAVNDFENRSDLLCVHSPGLNQGLRERLPPVARRARPPLVSGGSASVAAERGNFFLDLYRTGQPDGHAGAAQADCQARAVPKALEGACYLLGNSRVEHGVSDCGGQQGPRPGKLDHGLGCSGWRTACSLFLVYWL
mmetsp:Transcript_73728/g.196482  ORF Transcript_73728/g.196482 Transcript_73728/m.196482 type:complete len:216 (+) Transcript_73728:660-1307(+)